MPVDLRQHISLEVVHASPLLPLVKGEGFEGHRRKVELGHYRLPVARDERAGGVAVVLGEGVGGEGESDGLYFSLNL